MAYAIGIMSGTSLDGIDVALVNIKGVDETTTCELIHYHSYPYSKETQEKVMRVSHVETSNVAEICSLNFELGQLYNKAVHQLLNDYEFTHAIDFIALHGQTIHHLPHPDNGLTHSTLQIGNPSLLAYDHETTVISNFRAMDMVADGNGAPLVPFTEQILFCDADKNRVLQNIGGIGNATILPKSGAVGEILAFDTGPGNMMMNCAMQYFYGKAYDRDGLIARSGTLISELLLRLKSMPYFRKKPPKATGRELFGESLVHSLCREYQDQPEDLINTLTELAAWSIADSYRNFVVPKMAIDEVIISGGGAYNRFLLERIQEYLAGIEVKTQEDIGFNSDAKEAVAFAILGNQTLHQRPSNLMSATGAKATVILGDITQSPWGKKE